MKTAPPSLTPNYISNMWGTKANRLDQYTNETDKISLVQKPIKNTQFSADLGNNPDLLW